MGAMASAGAAAVSKGMDAANAVNNGAYSIAGIKDKSVGGPMSHMQAFDDVGKTDSSSREETDTQVISKKDVKSP